MEEQTMDRFHDFLVRKNIDAEGLSLGKPEIFQKWKEMFAELNEDSFVMQQKFQLNPIRRSFPLVRHQSLKSDKNG
jgi:hypothetical protein